MPAKKKVATKKKATKNEPKTEAKTQAVVKGPSVAKNDELVIRGNAELGIPAVRMSLDEVKKYIAPNATDEELFRFLGQCNAYQLNPLKREIYFVKYKENKPGQVVVGYESYLKKAEQTGKLDGWKTEVCERPTIKGNGQIGQSAGVMITIHRKGWSQPFEHFVPFSEFNTGQSTHNQMPTFMLLKTAVGQGMRLAFPTDMGGMPYMPDELPNKMVSGGSEDLPREPISISESEVEVSPAPGIGKADPVKTAKPVQQEKQEPEPPAEGASAATKDAQAKIKAAQEAAKARADGKTNESGEREIPAEVLNKHKAMLEVFDKWGITATDLEFWLEVKLDDWSETQIDSARKQVVAIRTEEQENKTETFDAMKAVIKLNREAAAQSGNTADF